MNTEAPELRRVAVLAAQRAGEVLRRAYSEAFAVSEKGTIDLVTSADRASEECILELLGREVPDHAVLAEESGASGAQGAYRWVVDPLDGTVNFAHKLPHFCVTLAVEERTLAGWSALVGATLDPLRDELFVATRGEGARLNSQPISVSATSTLLRSVGASAIVVKYGPRSLAMLNVATRLPSDFCQSSGTP